jgi:hypothetical protein
MAMAIALLAILGWPLQAQQAATGDDDKPHFELMPYIVLGGLGGDITLRGRTASFSQSATEVLSDLQFGFMGRTRVSYKKWFVGVDGTYMGLGAANDLVDAGVDQVIVEMAGGYKVAPVFEILGGARYNSLSIETNFRGPQATQLTGSKNWWDPFLGGRLIIPFGEKYSVSTRFDVGGFGAGSKVAINAEPLFNMKVGKRGTFHAGWKFYYVDYKDNADQFRWAVLSQGPMLGMTLRW